MVKNETLEEILKKAGSFAGMPYYTKEQVVAAYASGQQDICDKNKVLLFPEMVYVAFCSDGEIICSDDVEVIEKRSRQITCRIKEYKKVTE